MTRKFSDYLNLREQEEGKASLVVPARIKLSKNSGEFAPFNVSKSSRANLRTLLKAFEISDQVGVGYTTIDKSRGEVEPMLKRKSVYLTGGAVRDHLMGKTPRNYNLVTDATASEIRMILKHPDNDFSEVKPYDKDLSSDERYRSLPSASSRNKMFYASRWDDSGKEKEFTVNINGENFYLATMSRSPKGSLAKGSFDAAPSVEDDASNRDFTVNAMYIPLNNSDGDNTELIDPFGGAHHMKVRQVVPVNDDFESRFAEDPSIAMRYVKMLCKYGDPDKPCKKIVGIIKGGDKSSLPREIIKKDFVTSLEDPDVDVRKMLRLMDSMGILNLIMPGYDIHEMPTSLKGDRFLTPAWLMRNSDPDLMPDCLGGCGWGKSEASDLSHLVKLHNWAKSSFDPHQFYDLRHSKCGLTRGKMGEWMKMNGFSSPHVKAFLTHDDSDIRPYVDTMFGKKINPEFSGLLGHNPRGEDFELARRHLSTKRFLDSIQG